MKQFAKVVVAIVGFLAAAAFLAAALLATDAEMNHVEPRDPYVLRGIEG